MSLLSPRLQIKLAQKQILTPSLLQMVTVLQLNRLELKEMINQEIVENPVLEESTEETGEEITPEELMPLLEGERVSGPEDSLLEGAMIDSAKSDGMVEEFAQAAEVVGQPGVEAVAEAPPAADDPFDEIDFGSFFDDYLDPGYKSPTTESADKPSFETFLSQPFTLTDHLHSQLSITILSEDVRAAAEAIIGNLNEDGYLTAPLEEIAAGEEIALEQMQEGLKAVQALDPAGIGARDLKECLLLQLDSLGGRGGVAYLMVENHLSLVERRDYKELVKALGRPQEHIDIALAVIRRLNPRPGLRYSGAGARIVEPDVYISKEGDDYIIQLNDEDIPQLRLNAQYRKMLERDNGATKEVRNYVKERYTSAIQLMKNIEQRKQTILKVCQSIVRRQMDFLANGIDDLKPMMIKEVAEEVGVHPSTVSRAVAGKYAHTPQGVYELRYFFSEAVQGPSGGGISLLNLKRMVKKMIDEEDKTRPLTDEQITAVLQSKGIQVTRRTVAKYREDMKIPSTHQRRIKT
ncbi:MAG: RNA polymerase factor sigma-54 [Acidobacteria bacterium]|nr:RNA polymerase factor sigma-54 [Acidobacteriota bacterium]MBI3473845.1 RNA polymerase factor sigma-54 [Candidatus Solibacter usitatus]